MCDVYGFPFIPKKLKTYTVDRYGDINFTRNKTKKNKLYFEREALSIKN